MALTKVTGQVIKNTTDVTVGVLTVTNTLAVGGTVSIGGTLTYEDVTNVDAVGLITARNGIVVGSGITLSKDGDIFATGITTISENLKVGTGVTISRDGDGFFTGVITATSYSGIDLSDVTGATGDFSIADKIVHTGDTNTVIRFPAADTFTVETGGSERARIDSSGNFLVRTTSLNNSSVDGQALQINGTTRPTLILRGNADDNQVAEIQFADNSGSDDANTGVRAGLIQYSHASNFMAFRTSASERLRIDSSGRLLIGTTTEGQSSADDLTIEGSANTGITIRSGTSNTGNLYFSDGTSSTAEYEGYIEYDHSGNFLRFGTAASERVRIDSSGRLLIGTTTEGDSTADNLTIADSGTCGITIRSGTTSEGNIFFSDGTSGAAEYAGTIQYNHSSNYMQFATDGSERMRIVSDGRVSIGGMAPDTGVNLHIESSGETNMLLEGSASGVGGYLMLKNKNNTANSSMSIQFLDASGQGVSEINGVAMSDANNQGYLAFKTRPNGGSMTERFRVSDIGVQEYTQQSNVRTFNFAFSGGVGGSTTTQNIATLSNFAGSTNAVAHVYYVGTYGLANDYIYSGIWVCGTRRKNSNSGWNAQSTQTANGGSGSAGPVVIGWDAGVLQFTCTAFMGYTLHVSLTVYNATTTINAL